MSTQPPRSQPPVQPRQPVQPVPEVRRRRGIMEQIRLTVLGLIVLSLLVFTFLNLDRVEVRLLFWEPRLRLAWALLGAALLGFIAGWLVPRLPHRTRR